SQPEHPGKDADVQVGLQEMYRAVGEPDVGPAGVEAIDFSVVHTINGTRAVDVGPVRRGAFAPQQVSRGPGAAGQPEVRDLLASLPECGPARAFGYQDRVRGAVTDVRQAPGAVDREDPLEMPQLVTRATGGINQAKPCQLGVKSTHAGIVPAGGRAVERRGSRGE